MLRAKVREPQGGFVCTAGVHYGNTAWGGMKSGVCVTNLKFWGGALFCIPLLPLSFSIPIPWILSGGASGSFSDQWKQELSSKSSIGLILSYFCPSPQPIWAFILASTFPLGLRSKEVGSLMVSVSICPLIFSVTTLLCCLLAKDFLLHLSVWVVPWNYILHLL